MFKKGFFIKALIIQAKTVDWSQKIMKSRSKHLIFTVFLITMIQDIQTKKQTPQINISSQYSPFTVQAWHIFEGQRRCGFKDKNIYMNNGTYEEIGFYSRSQFSLFAETDEKNISITGIAISTRITQQSLRSLTQKLHRLYEIGRQRLEIVYQGENSITKAKKNRQPDDSKSINKIYYANLKVYGVCRTASVSTMSKNLEVKITYLSNQGLFEPFPSSNSKPSQQPKNSAILIPNTQTILIPTVVYCIDGLSIKQANFFVCKIYYVLIFSIIALLLSFKPFKRVPLLMRVISLTGFTWMSIRAETLYQAMLVTYGVVFLLVILSRMFEQIAPSRSQMVRRETIVSKTYILISFASALPLTIKSHLDDESVEQKKIILYPISFVMMCNTILFISSMVHLNRFRHAFCYFMALVLAENYFNEQVRSILAFGILEFQIFSVPFDCQSLFFALWLIPLCDFFFKAYSSDSMYKLVILLVPVLAKPFEISFSMSFILGILAWIVNGRFSGRDIIKIIKYKR